jgi:hypothetical protein
MDLKVQVDDDGSAYVAAIDPVTGDHLKAATVGFGQELNIDVNSLTLDDVDFGEVIASGHGETEAAEKPEPKPKPKPASKASKKPASK